MPGPYHAKSVANLFIRKSISDGLPIDPMKLQKLIYFAHGYYLARTYLREGRAIPLVNEFFEAWDYGPVLPSVYHEFKDFGSSNITKMAMEFRREFRANIVVLPPTDDSHLDRISSFVWDRYAKRHSLHLSDLTHKQGGAWDKARQAAHGIRGKDIPNDDIKDDFAPYVK
jgi:uncharacterized phage-associated protein